MTREERVEWRLIVEKLLLISSLFMKALLFRMRFPKAKLAAKS